MATLTLKEQTVLGNMRVGIYDFDFDSSYPDGGESLSASSLGLSEILYVDILPRDEVSGKMIYDFDLANSKIQVLYPTGGAAPAALAAPAFTVTSGATAMTGTAAVNAAITETAGIGVEVAASTDLSTIKVRLLVYGK